MSGHGARVTRPIERRTVSRKTAGDGKLEITKVAAGRLESLGSRFPLTVNDHDGEATLATMPCMCRGEDTPHVHYFVASDLLRSLAVDSEVDLSVDDAETRLFVVSA